MCPPRMPDRLATAGVLVSFAVLVQCGPASGAATTLSDPSLEYQVPEKPYVTLKRGPVEAVVVDNRAGACCPGRTEGLSLVF